MTGLIITHCSTDRVQYRRMDKWHAYRRPLFNSWVPQHIWIPSQMSARFWRGNKSIQHTQGHLYQNIRGWTVSVYSIFTASANFLASIHSGAPTLSAQPQNIMSAQIIAAAIQEHQEGLTTEDESEWMGIRICKWAVCAKSIIYKVDYNYQRL